MEIWKEVPGFEKYSVSNMGRVRCGSLFMKYYDNGLGYLVVRLRKEGDRRRRFYVHRLVLMTFNPTKEKLEVNHIDHNKTNNRLDNLEWVTHKQNLIKAVLFLGKQAFCK